MNNKVIAFTEAVRRLRGEPAAPSRQPDSLEAIFTKDDIGAVVRAHLYCEWGLRKLVEPHFSLEERGALTFTKLVSEARKRRLIGPDIAESMFALNRLRVDFVHSPGFVLDCPRLAEFTGELRGLIREMYEECVPEIEGLGWDLDADSALLRTALAACMTPFDEEFLGVTEPDA